MDREDYHQQELSLFMAPPSDVSLQTREWIEYTPTHQLTDGGPLEFNIPAQSAAYADLKRSKLRIKLRLVYADGKPVSDSDVLAFANLPLHTIFGQVEVAFQQTPLSHTGNNYAYKAYIDTILKSNTAEQEGALSAQLFYKDDVDVGTNDAKTGSNTGLKNRYNRTLAGVIVDLEGALHLDLFRQPKLLINGVHIGLKLWQTPDAFRIITDNLSPTYKAQIVDARFKLCIQRPQSAILLAHEKLIQDGPAIYPYLRSEIKTMSIASGQYSFSADDAFQGQVPCKLIVGMVSAKAYTGDYEQNPFNFKHYDCGLVGFYVDGTSYPSKALQPNYEGDQYVDCYKTLTTFRKDVNVSYSEYKKGYCLYVLDIDPYYSFNTKRKGHCRLELGFSKPLPESVTVILYATFPEVLNIDKSRSVFVK